MITPTEIKQNEQIRTYIEKADEALAALGYTEHSYAHVTRVAHFAEKIMADLGYPRRMQELAWIAGYMHDIGNVINRIDHAQSGAVMAFRILDKLGMPADEIATVCSAIGNHDESTAFPVNAVAAALILADKTDVRRTRVRNRDKATFDIHDRVNYAVEKASTTLDAALACKPHDPTIFCRIFPWFIFCICIVQSSLSPQSANAVKHGADKCMCGSFSTLIFTVKYVDPR